MSSVAVTPPASSAGLERWFFSAMAGLLLVIAIVGFAPNSMAILTGRMVNPALIVHVHAALMSAWLLLFLLQAILVGQGSRSMHRYLGRAVFVLAPSILVLMAYMAISRFSGGNPLQLPVQTERVVLFGTLLTLAVIERRKDVEAHKRYMLLATIVPIDAGINRMAFLPDFGLGWGTPVWMLTLLLPLVAFDLHRFGKLHRATLLGGGPIAIFWSIILLVLASRG